jgi:hypothetical protein
MPHRYVNVQSKHTRDHPNWWVPVRTTRFGKFDGEELFRIFQEQACSVSVRSSADGPLYLLIPLCLIGAVKWMLDGFDIIGLAGNLRSFDHQLHALAERWGSGAFGVAGAGAVLAALAAIVIAQRAWQNGWAVTSPACLVAALGAWACVVAVQVDRVPEVGPFPKPSIAFAPPKAKHHHKSVSGGSTGGAKAKAETPSGTSSKWSASRTQSEPVRNAAQSPHESTAKTARHAQSEGDTPDVPAEPIDDTPDVDPAPAPPASLQSGSVQSQSQSQIQTGGGGTQSQSQSQSQTMTGSGTQSQSQTQTSPDGSAQAQSQSQSQSSVVVR